MLNDFAPDRSGNSAGESFSVRCPNGGTRLGKGRSAANDHFKIGPRLTGPARNRACRGQAGADRFDACQIRQEQEDWQHHV
jgi:hypothetical protein